MLALALILVAVAAWLLSSQLRLRRDRRAMAARLASLDARESELAVRHAVAACFGRVNQPLARRIEGALSAIATHTGATVAALVATDRDLGRAAGLVVAAHLDTDALREAEAALADGRPGRGVAGRLVRESAADAIVIPLHRTPPTPGIEDTGQILGYLALAGDGTPPIDRRTGVASARDALAEALASALAPADSAPMTAGRIARIFARTLRFAASDEKPLERHGA